MITLSWLDYLIFTLTLLISLLIGLHHAFKRHYKKMFCSKRKDANDDEDDEYNLNTKRSKIGDYLTANGSMPVLPIALSHLVTFFSTNTMLGMPAEVYTYGIQYFFIISGLILAILFGAFITGPMFSKLKVMSVFAYLKIRFDSELVRVLAVFCYLVRSLISSSLFIYGPAIPLNLVAGISPNVCISIIGVIAVFYTTIGGIRGVIYTDVFQSCMMFSGLALVLTKGIYDLGGFNELININAEGGRLNLFSFDPNPTLRHTFWSLSIGMLFYFSMGFSIDQQMVQRFACAKSVKNGKIAMLLSIPGALFLVGGCCSAGLVIYATYAKCDPLTMLKSNRLKSANQLLPFYVIDRLSSISGSAGLLLAALFASALSSVSSSLNSSAGILWHDFLRLFKHFRTYNDDKSTFTTKLLVLFCGLLATALSYLISNFGTNLIQISYTLNGSFNAPIIGVFLLGSCFPFTNKYGASVGIVAGFAMGLWLSIGAYIYKPTHQKLGVSTIGCNMSNYTFNNYTSSNATTTVVAASGITKFYSVSHLWFTTIGALTTVLAGILVSLLTNCNRQKPIDRNFLIFNCSKRGVEKQQQQHELELLDAKN